MKLQKLGEVFTIDKIYYNANQSTLCIRMFGGFELAYEGKLINESSNRSYVLWNLLGYLVTYHSRSIPQSEFIDTIWADSFGDNPLSSLKTSFSRLRAFLEPITPEGTDYILSSRGSYQWNENVAYCLDIDFFESYCRQGSLKSLPRTERIAAYQKALELYKGDFLPKLKDTQWVVPLTTYYHSIYIEAIKDLYQLLKEENRIEEMIDCCAKALIIEAFDEKLHCNLIEALMLQGHFSSALLHHQKATELLYKNLSVQPSGELNQLYHSLMSYQSDIEMDSSVIMNHLKETEIENGAFVCNYGVFKEIYQLALRQSIRSKTSNYICILLTIFENNHIPSLDTLNLAMPELLASIILCLRSGDVVSKYSGAQYLLLLPCLEKDNAIKIIERIQDDYYRKHKKSTLYLNYSLSPLLEE